MACFGPRNGTSYIALDKFMKGNTFPVIEFARTRIGFLRNNFRP